MKFVTSLFLPLKSIVDLFRGLLGDFWGSRGFSGGFSGSRPGFKMTSKGALEKKSLEFLSTFLGLVNDLKHFRCSRGAPEAPRIDFEGSGDPPGWFRGRIFRDFWRGLPGTCRGNPSVTGTPSPGFIWGTAISRSGLN